MKIVFYSSNSNYFEGENFELKRIPLEKDSWITLCKKYPDCTFTIISQLPGTFLLDIKDRYIIEEYEQISNSRLRFILSEAKDSEEFAREILEEKADIAIAASFWVTPFDWLPLEDALIASILRNNNMKVLCSSPQSALNCMDKAKSQEVFIKAGLPCAKGFSLDLQLFRAERSHKEIKNNVYREYVEKKIQEMNYPLVIKSTTGLSSYSMGVAVSFKQAMAYLNSGKTNSDRIIEEYIDGIQAGAEVYGKDGKYTIFPPFLFSVSKWGLTSPKQSIKVGPVKSEKFKLDKLNKILTKAADAIKLNGIMQVDLVFKGDQWYIIEINPRISGMSETYAAAGGTSVKELLLQTALDIKINSDLDYTFNFKLPLLTDQQMNMIASESFVKTIRQNKNKAARQEREKGYCEIIFGGRKNLKELEQDLTYLSQKYPTFFEDDFLLKAKDLLSKM